MRFHDNLNILIQRQEEAQQAFDGELAEVAAQHLRDVGLTDSEQISRFHLLQAAFFFRIEIGSRILPSALTCLCRYQPAGHIRSHFSVILISRRNTACASSLESACYFNPSARIERARSAAHILELGGESELRRVKQRNGDTSTVLVRLLPATTTATSIFIWIQTSTWRSCPVRLSPVGP
jgi:hypothetical protein